MRFSEYKNKKVLIAGLGRYKQGSGISAAKFFYKNGARVTVTDLKIKKDLAQSTRELRGCKIKYVLGKHRVEDFKAADLVIKNPGMRRNSPYLLAAKKAGVPIESDITIFFKHCPAMIIGITGTRGKSTTSALAHEMLKKKNKRTFLGGNIKISPLNFLHKLKKGDWVVVELSSWMLEDLDRAKLSPYVGVITNILRDHLNTYPSLSAYQKTKALIFKYQSKEDFVVLNRDNKICRKFGKNVPSKRFWFSKKKFEQENGSFVLGQEIIFRNMGRELEVAKVRDLNLPGEHNLYNSLAALAVAKILRVPCCEVRKTLRAFKGLPDRQELVRTYRGVKYYNDTTATTPEACIAALRVLGQNKNIILIAGGADKKLVYNKWAKEVKKHTRGVVLFEGKATQKMKKELAKNKVKILKIVKTMPEVVGVARKNSQKGDVVLLSPAAASFGLFQNEFDRGEQFIRLIKALK